MEPVAAVDALGLSLGQQGLFLGRHRCQGRVDFLHGLLVGLRLERIDCRLQPRVLPNLDQLGEALGSPLPGRGQRLQTRLLGGVVGGEPFQIAEQNRAAA